MSNTNEKKKTCIAVVLFVLVFGALLSLATVFDLRVSQILVDLEPGEYITNNLFGAIFEAIGSWPVYLCLSVSFAIFFANTFKAENKWLRILGSLAANIATIVASYILVTDTVSYINQHSDFESFSETSLAKIAFVFIGIAVAELIILPFTKMDKETLKVLLKLSFVIIFTAALSNIIVNIIKNIMYRPRYRTMNLLGDGQFSMFHRWYQKNDNHETTDFIISAVGGSGMDAFRSFPSGHTCAAGTVYSLLALPHILDKYNTKKNIVMLYVITILVTGVVAVSRIVCGAHFFSDVLVGGTLSYLSAMLAIKIFIRKDFKRV